MTPHPVLAALAEDVVIPVIRESDADRAHDVIGALREGGFRVFEVTMSVPGAIDVIAELAQVPGLTVGVGTVLTEHDALRAVAAGARFVVSPALVPGVAEAARSTGAAVVLGALTPTEVLAARAAGADAVKIFPANSVGGPGHLRALRSVFPSIPLIPTGGVDLSNISSYLDAGAHSVGVGSALSGTEIDDIAALGRRYLAAAGAAPPHSGKDHT